MSQQLTSILSNQTDNELVSLACNNQEAMNLLLKRYQNKTNILIYRYVDAFADVQDISQEVLLKLYNSIPTFQHNSSFHTWHYRIVMNTISSYFRQPYYKLASNAVNYEDFDNISSKLLNYDDPQDLLIAEQAINSLQKLFQTMPAELVEVVVFFEIDGRSYQEIAQKLKCPIGTVRSRIHRARNMVTNVLGSVP